MIKGKTHVYFVPGMAAGKEIFRNIVLPKDQFEVHIIEWLIPKKNERIEAYAKRMASYVIEPNSVLIGVSFGGVMVQEMSQFLKLKALILISSVKTKHELPRRLKFVRKTSLYKLVPTRLIIGSQDLTKYAVGPRSKKRLKLYDEYLHVRDARYLDWAIKNMVMWNQDIALDNVYHLHGDADIVFPIKNVSKATICPNGTHIMILNKASWISNKIIEIINNN